MNQNFDEILESAVVANWVDLMRGAQRGSSAVLAVGHIALTQRKVYRPEFSQSQSGTVPVAKPILTVLEVAPMLRDGRFASLGFSQS